MGKDAARIEARQEPAKEGLAQQKEKVQITKDLEEQKRIREGYLRDRKHIRDELSQYRTEKSLSTQQLQEQQQQLAGIHKHNAELFHVCKALKMKMDALLQELEQSRSSDEMAVPTLMFQNLDSSTLSGDLAEELAQKQTVLKAAKRIARKMLMQRADLESFLTDSIQVCRDQTLVEQKQKMKDDRLAMLQGVSAQKPHSSDGSMQEEPASSSLHQDTGISGDAPSSTQLDGEVQDSEVPEDPDHLKGTQDENSGGLSSFKSVPISKLSWRQRELLLKMIFKKINECQDAIGPTRNKLKHSIRVL